MLSKCGTCKEICVLPRPPCPKGGKIICQKCINKRGLINESIETSASQQARSEERKKGIQEHCENS